MLYECDDNNCGAGRQHCTNRAFADLQERRKGGGKYRIGVEVIKTADRGYGVRSNRCFDPHQIIVEYTGEIITEDECDRRMNEDYKDNEVSCKIWILRTKVNAPLVLLPDVFRPEYDHRRHKRQHCSIRQPLLQT
jgi:hypothetical protein